MTTKIISAVGKIAASAIGVFAGIYAMFYSLAFQSSPSVNYISDEIYGGDAYTGIQNAAADTGNNIMGLAYYLDDVLSAAILIAGLFMTMYFAVKIFEGIGELDKARHDDTSKDSPSKTNCPTCHAPVNPGSSFCTSCGASLDMKSDTDANSETDPTSTAPESEKADVQEKR